MKAATFAFILAAGFARLACAETFECPQRYAGAPLIGGSMYDGPNHEYELVGTPREFKDGQAVSHQFPGAEAKWLACWYGKGGAVQWRRVSTTATQCTVKETRSRDRVRVTADCR